MAKASRWAGWVCGLALVMLGSGCDEAAVRPVIPGDRHDTPPLNDGYDGGDGDPHPGLIDAGSPDAGSEEPGPPDAGPVEPPPRDSGAVREENRRPGTTAWRITRNAHSREIEGYALKATVTQGETLRVAVSVSEARAFRWYVYRMGHYGGTGAREVARGGPVPGVRQGDCPADRATGVVHCAGCGGRAPP